MKWFGRLAIAGCLVIFAACSTAPKKEAPPPPAAVAVNELNKIKSEMARSKTETNLRRLQKYVSTNPASDSTDEAWVLIGNIHFQKQDYKNAFQAYSRVANATYQSHFEIEARSRGARCLYQLGRYDESLGMLEVALTRQGATIQQQADLHELRYVIEQQLGNWIESLRDLAFLGAQHPTQDRRERFKLKGYEIVESKLGEAELEKVAGDNSFAFFQPRALYRLGSIAWDHQEISRARDYMSDVKDKAPNTDIAERAQKIIEAIDARRRVSSNTIGVILPLSGRYASIGYKTLRGIQLALGIFGPNPSSLHLAISDSEGNPDVARRDVEKLITEDSAVAVIGGLLSKTAFAEAAKAQEMGVPMLALSQVSGLTDVGDFIFRNSLTSQMQVHALVSVAMNKMELKHFALLYPSDSYGTEFAHLFWDEIQSRGGSVQGAQIYDPKETDFHVPIMKMVGTFYAEERADEYKLRLKEWEEKQDSRSQKKPPSDLLPPIVDFEALFIPDNVKAVGQIAPMLAYSDVQNVRLLGTNLWNTPDLVKRGQKFVENAVFVDSFMDSDPALKTSSFYHDYKQTFQEDPSLFEVQAYDSGLILRELLASGESTRIGLKERLAKLHNFSGALGNLNMSDKHEVERPVVVLTVKNGTISKF